MEQNKMTKGVANSGEVLLDVADCLYCCCFLWTITSIPGLVGKT